MLLEIHKSKCSYCDFDNYDKHHQFDIILESRDDLDNESISQAKQNKAKRISTANYKKALGIFHNDPDSLPKNKPKQAEFYIDPESLSEYELVFRIVTYEHIPLAPGRKKNPKKIPEYHVKLNFIPFKHYTIRDDTKISDKFAVFNKLAGNGSEIIEVGRSHSSDYKFSDTHGAMTPTLANMLTLLVTRYSQRSNWRGYSYVDEMRGQSLLQLSQMGLLFNEAKSDNPFAYFTAAISNSFTRILNLEKKQQIIRDDLLESQGKTPSFTRQLENDQVIRQIRDDVNGSS